MGGEVEGRARGERTSSEHGISRPARCRLRVSASARDPRRLRWPHLRPAGCGQLSRRSQVQRVCVLDHHRLRRRSPVHERVLHRERRADRAAVCRELYGSRRRVRGRGLPVHVHGGVVSRHRAMPGGPAVRDRLHRRRRVWHGHRVHHRCELYDHVCGWCLSGADRLRQLRVRHHVQWHQLRRRDPVPASRSLCRRVQRPEFVRRPDPVRQWPV